MSTYAGYIILVTRPDLSSLDDPAYVDLSFTGKIIYEIFTATDIHVRGMRPPLQFTTCVP
jgi:hypothetical protein